MGDDPLGIIDHDLIAVVKGGIAGVKGVRPLLRMLPPRGMPLRNRCRPRRSDPDGFGSLVFAPFTDLNDDARARFQIRALGLLPVPTEVRLRVELHREAAFLRHHGEHVVGILDDSAVMRQRDEK
jgi:hypothetical protein